MGYKHACTGENYFFLSKLTDHTVELWVISEAFPPMGKRGSSKLQYMFFPVLFLLILTVSATCLFRHIKSIIQCIYYDLYRMLPQSCGFSTSGASCYRRFSVRADAELTAYLWSGSTMELALLLLLGLCWWSLRVLFKTQLLITSDVR